MWAHWHTDRHVYYKVMWATEYKRALCVYCLHIGVYVHCVLFQACERVRAVCPGEGSLCGWSSGVVRGKLCDVLKQDETGNKRGRSGGKSPSTKVQTFAPVRESSPAGPLHGHTHKYTPDLPLQRKHQTHTHLYPVFEGLLDTEQIDLRSAIKYLCGSLMSWCHMIGASQGLKVRVVVRQNIYISTTTTTGYLSTSSRRKQSLNSPWEQ